MTPAEAPPLVLRREGFGGILFDPMDATFMELDDEAYAAVADFARHPRRRRPEATERLLDEVRENLANATWRPVRQVAPEATVADAPVPVLSAPTLVDFQITNKCHLDCPHCYASSTSAGQHGALADIEMALGQIAEVGAFQVAIGGGEPLLHPDIGRILERCRALGIVPNLTTSGLNLDDAMLDLLYRHCGAVGVSLEGVGDDFDRYRKTGFARFERTVSRLLDRGVPTVLQVTLNVETFARLHAIVEYCRRWPGLYGVIFLAFKPVGRGARFGQPLALLPHRQLHDALQAAFLSLAEVTRVGFDCCLTPGVAGLGSAYDSHAAQHLEGCSALRTSIGLSPDLDVMPCTFTAEHAVGNLKDKHLRDIWRDLTTVGFRSRMAARSAANASCSSCAKHSYCLGGCPVMNLVNCSRDYLAAQTG